MMKSLWSIGLLLILFHSNTIIAQKIVSGKSSLVHVKLKPECKRGLPPNLYADLTYEDGNNNGILESNEKSLLRLRITNKGKGPAQGLFVKIKDNIYDPEFHVQDGQKIPFLYPGQSTEVNVPKKAGFDIKTKEHKLEILVTERTCLVYQYFQVVTEIIMEISLI